MKLPMIKVDKFSNTVVIIKPANEIIKPARRISFRGMSNMFPSVFILASLWVIFMNSIVLKKELNKTKI